MKIAVALAVAALAVPAVAADSNPLETTDQARQRQSAENYEKQKRQDNTLLPPTYQQPLGSPNATGAERPGYVTPTYRPPQPAPSYGGSWQDRAKGKSW